MFLAAVCVFGFAAAARAEDKPADKPAPAEKAPAKVAPADGKPAAAGKPVTLTGTMVCGKCTLNETAKCQNVLKVKKAGAAEEEKYYLADNGVAKKNHDQVCSGEAKATVKGTVAEADGKKVLTAASIKYQ
jgi:hypothetical protein